MNVWRRRWTPLLFVMLVLATCALASGDTPPAIALEPSPPHARSPHRHPTDIHGVMHPDAATMQRWVDAYEAAPRAEAASQVQGEPALRGAHSLLSHISYVPAERDQGTCGNCWSWAGTGVLEIAMDVQEGIRDRLSVQYVGSCYNNGSNANCACCGGWLDDLATWYRQTGHAIPWSNSNAAWVDGSRQCQAGGNCTGTGMACGNIGTSPRYAIQDCRSMTIETQTVSQQQAIANIKAVLDQNKAVWWGFYWPNQQKLNEYLDFWENQPESALWDPSHQRGQYWDPNSSGGHAVLCVGYDDTNPQNAYWIMLNSWGTPAGRPNGLFRVPINMDYGCYSSQFYSFFFQTLDVTFGDTPTATPTLELSPTPTATQPPQGQCQPAYAATCGTVHTHNNSGPGSTDRIDSYDCSNWEESGPEYTYAFTTAQTGPVRASLSGIYPGCDLDLFVLDGQADLVCDAARCITSGNNAVEWEAVAGHTYYVVVDGYWGSYSPYTIAFDCGTAPTPTPTTGPYLWLEEAERGVRHEPMSTWQHEDASDCGYVFTELAGHGDIEMAFRVPQYDRYYVWARVRALDWDRNSFWIGLYGHYEYYCEFDPYGDMWTWQRVQSLGGMPGYYDLYAGAHTMRFRGAEAGTDLDAVLITNDLYFVPTEHVPCVPVISPTPTLSPTPTPTATLPPPPPFDWREEAEQGVLYPAMASGTDPDASNCGFASVADLMMGGSAQFTVEVPRTGAYYLWARSAGAGEANNAFYVSCGANSEFLYEIPQVGGQWGWHWNRVVPPGEVVAPVQLGAGHNTIAFRACEAHAKLDAVLITNDPQFVPTQVVPCAATPTTTSTPAEPTMTPTGGVPTIPHDPTATQTQTPGPTPTITVTATPEPTFTPQPTLQSRHLWLPLVLRRQSES